MEFLSEDRPPMPAHKYPCDKIVTFGIAVSKGTLRKAAILKFTAGEEVAENPQRCALSDRDRYDKAFG